MFKYVLAQIALVISIVFLCVSFQIKSRRNILLLQSISSFFFALQYIFLDSYIASVIVICEILRNIVFYFIDKKSSLKFRIIWSVLFLILGMIVSILLWESWYSILPIFNYCLITIVIVFAGPLLIKFCCTIGIMINILYLLILNSFLGVIFESVLLIFGIIGVINQIKINKKNKQNTLKNS